ncbi:transposon Tf2-9 polyprotein [Nephila pilipes]|uniref:Transposon Tf2-9 polyprotein n=1 Tax=Nephila pilipes TaxID=299642 RepID=A0A8X6PSM8_NEPPI|nr:transposon Tf2-9 polyprotein [Nephila pilipes]
MTILKTVFARFGAPDTVFSDNIPFNSYIYKNFSNEWDFNYAFISLHYSPSNGMVERAVGIAKSIMRKAKEDKRDYLLGLMEYRNTPISDLDLSPAQMMFNRRLETKLPISNKLLNANYLITFEKRETLKDLKLVNEAIHDLLNDEDYERDTVDCEKYFDTTKLAIFNTKRKALNALGKNTEAYGRILEPKIIRAFPKEICCRWIIYAKREKLAEGNIARLMQFLTKEVEGSVEAQKIRDGGSQENFVNINLIDKLKLNVINSSSLRVQAFESSFTQEQRRYVQLTLSGSWSKRSISVTAFERNNSYTTHPAVTREYINTPEQFVSLCSKWKGFCIEISRSLSLKESKMSEEAQPSASPVVDPEASPTEKPSERAQCSIEVSNSPESPAGGDSSSLLETPPEMHAFEIGFPTPPASPEHRFHKKRLIGALAVGVALPLLGVAVYFIVEAIINKS